MFDEAVRELGREAHPEAADRSRPCLRMPHIPGERERDRQASLEEPRRGLLDLPRGSRPGRARAPGGLREVRPANPSAAAFALEFSYPRSPRVREEASV